MICKRLLLCLFVLLLVSSDAVYAQTTAPAEGVLQRLMPQLAPQFQLALVPRADHKDYFRITGTTGHIRVEAATTPTLLFGVNWYLKYVAHLQISTNGLQLGRPGLKLPAVATPIERPALYPWRYALNENVDGYSAPYWGLKRWQREIDILAMSGTNAVLIERGTDLVLYQTFRDAGYSDEAIRRWITQPAHQNWQLMGNMCCFDEPISMELLKKRAESAKELIASLRRLGITPVLPGYYGIVPADFATTNPGAHVVTQGDWNGFTRPGWLDPRDSHFAKLAASFYRHQRELYGDTTIYDMEVFQEGGTAGDVPVTEGAKRVQEALERAHPNALWLLMAWQKTPSPELIAGVDVKHILVADIEQGGFREIIAMPSLVAPHGCMADCGSLAGATMGAPLYDYAVRFPLMAKRPGSHIAGTALFTEGLDTNPYAFDLYTEMAWHDHPVDLAAWTDGYAERRYGGEDAHARKAWQILLKTAYSYRADGNRKHGERDASQDSLFNAQPSLTTLRAASPGPDVLRYNAADLQPALTELLQVAPALRTGETYRYDLVDVARQVMANESRRLLPLIKAAYDAKDKAAFARLTAEWLHDMTLQDDLLRTDGNFLLGRWLSYVAPWSSSPAETERLNYDARSILTTWGDRSASEAGHLHEYGNKDWAGLTSDYYLPRWKLYFDSLTKSLATGQPAAPIDWYAMGNRWNHSRTHYTATPEGDSYAAALEVARQLHLAPGESK